MSTGSGDQDLRELFARARTSGFERTPPFERVRRGRSQVIRTTRPVRWALAGGFVAVLLVGTVVTVRRRAVETDAEALVLARQISGWRSPTDFLLRVPGAEYLAAVPRVGEIPRWYPFDRAGDGLAPSSQRKGSDSL